MIYEEIKPGDKIVIRPAYGPFLDTVVVLDVSKKVITLTDKRKFSRTNGKKWGEGDRISATRIAESHKGSQWILMTWEEAIERNEEVKLFREKKLLVDQIVNSKELLMTNSLETIKKICELIGVDTKCQS